MKKNLILLKHMLVLTLFSLILSISFAVHLGSSKIAWAETKEPDWDHLDKVTLKMLDVKNIVFTQDIKRHADNEVKYNFTASDAINDVLAFYWNDPGVAEILAINDVPLKQTQFKSWAGKINPKLKGLKALQNPDRIKEVAASEKRHQNMEVIDTSIITLRMNGQLLRPDVVPYIKEGRVMVPFRSLYEAMGGKVSYDFGTEKRVWMRIDQGEGAYTELSMTLGSKTARKTVHTALGDTLTEILMEVSPEIKKNRTFIPARYAGELLDLKVRWNNDIREVLISGDLPAKTTTNCCGE